MHPVLFTLGPVTIASYGLMNALAYFACIGYLIHYRKRINIEKTMLWDIVFVIIISAILGGKIAFFIFGRAELGATFAEQVKNFFLTFRYGVVFFGGLILAVASMLVFMKKKKLPVLKTADFLIIAVPLGQAIGRIGCFLAGCCHGREWHSAWAVTFTDPRSVVDPQLLGIPVYPVQLWESAVCLVIFAILHFSYAKKKHNGGIFSAYVVMYGLARAGLEYFRGDYRGGFYMGMSPSQWIGILAAIAATVFYFGFVKRGVYDDK